MTVNRDAFSKYDALFSHGSSSHVEASSKCTNSARGGLVRFLYNASWILTCILFNCQKLTEENFPGLSNISGPLHSDDIVKCICSA